MNTDPITLAREVVRLYGHLDRDALLHREKERLDLARAVIDLAAERDACIEENTRLREQVARARAFAAEIRAALNGDSA